MNHHRLVKGLLFFGVLMGCPPAYPQGADVQLEIFSETSIDFTADQSSFTLNFSDFTSGALTNTVNVTYSIMANDVVRTEDVVLARLDDTFPGMALQAEFSSYVKRGGNARLAAAASGFVTVTTSDIGLADKVIDEGDGKMLDGSFVIRYQAKALQDQAAGQHFRTLTVIFADT